MQILGNIGRLKPAEAPLSNRPFIPYSKEYMENICSGIQADVFENGMEMAKGKAHDCSALENIQKSSKGAGTVVVSILAAVGVLAAIKLIAGKISANANKNENAQ